MIFLPINLNMFLCAQKNPLIEIVHLSAHNLCFDKEIRKNALLSGVLAPEVIKLSMLNSAEHEIYPAHKC